MIEKYFRMGVRLRWTFPGDLNTGSRDGSTILNPPPPRGAGPMLYDGMDGDLYNTFAPHASTLGLKKGVSQIPYTWLVYSVGHTTTRMLAAGDVLTGYMSGCLITLWMAAGVRCVGHIGTDLTDPVASGKVKKTFAEYMPRDTVGFNPLEAWPQSEVLPMALKFKSGADPKIIALVTTGGQFYSLLLFKLSQNEWCVGGSKHVPPMNRDALYLHLKKLKDR